MDQAAGFGGAADLDLQRRMADAVVALQRLGGFGEEAGIGIFRHQQMRGQGGFGRAHRPDMQVVDVGDAGAGA